MIKELYLEFSKLMHTSIHLSNSHVSSEKLNFRARPRSPTARARIFAGFCTVSHSHIQLGTQYDRSDIS